MKASYFVLICLLAFSTTALQAVDEFERGIESEPLTGDTASSMEELSKVGSFWGIDGEYNWIRKSGFRTPGIPGKIGYHEGITLLSYNWFMGSKTAMQLGVGYGNTGIHWKENPAFHEQNFQDVSATIGVTSSCFDNWLWRSNLVARFNASATQVPTYVLYTGSMWGRYTLSRCFATHVGFIFETGLHKTKVWPIFGFDFKYNDCLKFYIVYPFEASINYAVCGPWSIEAATRQFRYRQRARKDEPLPRALFEYRNMGGELRLVYDLPPGVSANIHIGQTFEGDFVVADQNNHHSIHYKFKTAPYIGGELSLKF